MWRTIAPRAYRALQESQAEDPSVQRSAVSKLSSTALDSSADPAAALSLSEPREPLRTGIRFQLLHCDPHSGARLGLLETPRGLVETPCFMPVATRAVLQGVPPEEVYESGARILLANSYHLHLHPGEGIVAALNGLHAFMSWKGGLITDSGGFQIFSLPKRRVLEEGVSFQHPTGGQTLQITPKRSMEIQELLGADIAMALDECVPYPCSYVQARKAMERTFRWAKRCVAAHDAQRQALFGIVQGSTFADLRRASAEATAALELPGIAVGGLSVGEGREIMAETLARTVDHLPTQVPRYLMGVGLPEDILVSVECGMDMSDCVIPARYARAGLLFTRRGKLRILRGRYRRDAFPLDTACHCSTCRQFSRAYLHHLFRGGDPLARTLATIHNLSFYADLMREIRVAIRGGRLRAFRDAFLEAYQDEAPSSNSSPRLPAQAASTQTGPRAKRSRKQPSSATHAQVQSSPKR